MSDLDPIPFNKHLAEIVIKHLLGIISGYLNAAPHFLTSEITANKEINQKYENLKSLVNFTIQANKGNFPNSKEWGELMEVLASEPQILKTSESSL